MAGARGLHRAGQLEAEEARGRVADRRVAREGGVTVTWATLPDEGCVVEEGWWGGGRGVGGVCYCFQFPVDCVRVYMHLGETRTAGG